jgi:hypothetical protein
MTTVPAKPSRGEQSSGGLLQFGDVDINFSADRKTPQYTSRGPYQLPAATRDRHAIESLIF